MFIPILLILLSSGKILLFLGQDPEVTNQASIYILSITPGMLLLGMNDL